jgi:CRP-like cAMP-binding protein
MLRKAERNCGIKKSNKKDENAHLKSTVLRQGQLFGEISIIYKCLTTASVIALKYCTIGKLMQKDFNDIVLEHPKILQYVKEGIFEYNDKDMRFIKMALKQLPFFAYLQDRDLILFDIIYSLNTFKMNAQAMLMSVGDTISEIYIVEKGMVELYVNINGKELVLERLFRGSVINYKTIFREENCQVSMRFASESVIKSLSLVDLKAIRLKDKKLNRAIQKYELKVARSPAAPLDYMISLPKKVFAKLIDRTREKMLFGKQESLMETLQERKDFFKKH